VRRVRMVAVPWIVPVPWRVVVEEEHAAAGCAHAVRGAIQVIIGVGVGGSSSGSLHEQGCAELSHRAAQLEEEQNKCEHRVAGCTGDSDRTLTESPGRTS
jgi:hypothetical protein